MRLFCATVFRRCALVGPPPGLERRRIAAPRLRTRHRGAVRLAHRSMVRHSLNGADVRVGLKTRSVSKAEQILPADFGITRAEVSLPYTLAMTGFALLTLESVKG